MVRRWSRNCGGELLLLGLQIQVNSDKQGDRVFIDLRCVLLTWLWSGLADEVSQHSNISSLIGSLKVKKLPGSERTGVTEHLITSLAAFIQI